MARPEYRGVSGEQSPDRLHELVAVDWRGSPRARRQNPRPEAAYPQGGSTGDQRHPEAAGEPGAGRVPHARGAAAAWDQAQPPHLWPHPGPQPQAVQLTRAGEAPTRAAADAL